MHDIGVKPRNNKKNSDEIYNLRVEDIKKFNPNKEEHIKQFKSTEEELRDLKRSHEEIPTTAMAPREIITTSRRSPKKRSDTADDTKKWVEPSDWRSHLRKTSHKNYEEKQFLHTLEHGFRKKNHNNFNAIQNNPRPTHQTDISPTSINNVSAINYNEFDKVDIEKNNKHTSSSLR